MASVLRVLSEHHLGAREAVVQITWSPTARLAGAWLALRAALRVPSIGRSEILHVHLSERGSFVREGGIVLIAGALGRTTVVTIHGASFLPFVRAHTRLVSAILRRARFVTCLDPDVLAAVKRLAPDVQAELLPNPVTVEDGGSGAHETEEIVLFAGEIGLRKGADVLCRAWPMVAKSRPGARCIMVGPINGFDVPRLGRLDVRGPVGSDDLRQLVRSSRVIALPSRAEGMPMILTEAMSEARPFVSTPVGGIPELARAGGILVQVGDEVALARRLTELLDDRELARNLGERGREFCQRTRSLDALDSQFARVYSKANAA